MAFVYKGTDATIAHLPGVKAEVHAAGSKAQTIALGKLNGHRDERAAHNVTMTMGATDAHVELAGPAAESIEFGHFHVTDQGVQYTEGLHILRDTLREL